MSRYYSVKSVPPPIRVAPQPAPNMGVAVDARQIEMMQGMYASPLFYGWMVVFWLAYLGYLVYLRRYFQNANRM